MFRKKKVDPNEVTRAISVQFDKGGRIFTYNKTLNEVGALMEERFLLRGEWPYSVTTVVDGRVATVTFGRSP